MTAPTLLDYAESAWSGNSPASEVTDDLDWAASGDIIVCLGGTEDQGVTLGTPTATGLTFAALSGLPTTTASSCKGYGWSATGGGNGNSVVTATAGGVSNSARGISAWAFSGSGGLGTPVINTGTGLTVSVTTAADSSVVMVLFDWNASTDVTVTTSPAGGTIREASVTSGRFTAVVVEWHNQAAGTRSYGVTDWTGTGTVTKIAVQVLGTVGGAQVDGDAALTATAAYTATAAAERLASAAVTAAAGLVATAAATRLADASLTATATITAEGDVGVGPVLGQAELTATAGITAQAAATRLASASLTATAGITATASVTRSAQASLTVTAGMTATAVTGAQPVGSPSGGPWVLVFEDDFDNPVNGKPDPAVWADHLIEGDHFRCNDNPTELQWYTHDRRGVEVAGSVLSVIARNESPYTADPLCPDPLPSGNTGTYTSGMIQSHPSFQFTRGYAEARIRLPSATGSWPAFWMYTPDDVWPPEIDIQEYNANRPPNATYWNEASGTTTREYGAGPDYTDWHVFAVRWQAGSIAYFLDGVQAGSSITASITSLPMHLVVNHAVTTDETGAGFPCQIDVDYIRVWVTTGVPDQPVVNSITPTNGTPTGGTIQVAFDAVPGATSYRVTTCPIDKFADGWTDNTRRTATGSSSPLTVTNLQNGVRYSVTVAAINGTGYSIESLPVPSLVGVEADAALTATATITATAEVVPSATAALTVTATLTATGDVPSTWGPPLDITATPVSQSQIDLEWDAMVGASGYDIERDGLVIATDVVGTTFSDTGLDAATEYDYRLRSVRA